MKVQMAYPWKFTQEAVTIFQESNFMKSLIFRTVYFLYSV